MYFSWDRKRPPLKYLTSIPKKNEMFQIFKSKIMTKIMNKALDKSNIVSDNDHI